MTPRSLFRRIDWWLVVPVVLLISFSSVVIYSADPGRAQLHVLFACAGLLGFIALTMLDYRLLHRLAVPLFLGLIAVLSSLVLFGTEVRGSRRWLFIGEVGIQPSEFAKVAVIIILAAFLRRAAHRGVNLRTILLSLLLAGLPIGLVFLQPDLGTSLTFVAVWAGLLFSAGLPLAYVFGFTVLGIISLPVIWQFMQEYQRTRIMVFLNPHSDPLGAGYNVLQAMIAVGSGRLAGRGFGRGTQSHLRFLPEQHTDFIFATLAEEWGFLGVSLLLLFFLLLLTRIFMVAYQSRTTFGMLLCVGVAYLFMTQLLINIGMNMGVMPVTGLPLPLVSYGGSSMVASLAALGLVHSVAVRLES